MNIQDLITRLEEHIPNWQCQDENVSQGTVGWHISHSLLVIHTILEALAASDPSMYKRRFNWKRSYLLGVGRIPRGRIKAPQAVQPKGSFEAESLLQQAMQTRQKLQTLDSLHPGHFFVHPFLGMIRLRPARRFLQIHTKHHLTIIQDIVHGKAKPR